MQTNVPTDFGALAMEGRLVSQMRRATRALGLLVGLMAVYSHGDGGRFATGLVGVGLAYVSLTYLVAWSNRDSALSRWVRTTCDVALVALLVAEGGPLLAGPLRLLFAIPLIDAALRVSQAELAVAGLQTALALVVLDRPGGPATGGVPLGLSLATILLGTTVLVMMAGDLERRKRQEMRLQRSTRQLESLSAVAQAMRHTDDFETLARRIADAALEMTSAYAATLAVVSDSGDSLEPVAARSRGSEPPPQRIVPLEPGELGGPEGLPPVTVRDNYDPPGSIVTAPIVGAEDRVIGRLTILSPLPPEGLAPGDRAALAAFGQAAGVAIETAWLRDSLHRQTRDLYRRSGELTALVEVSRSLVSVDQHDVLDDILGKAIALMAAERGSLMLLTETGEELYIETARGLSSDVIESTRLRLGEGFAGRVAATGQPLRLIDTVEERDRRPDLRDALCVPLRVQDRIIGVLNLSNKTGPGVFTEQDLDFLTALANQAAIAIQNARLVGDVQDLFLSTIRSLAQAVDAKDRYTAGHSQRVTAYALAIADELEMSDAEQDLLRIAGLMHDVGKIGVPEAILRKPGPLDETEQALMRQHPLLGARIVEPIRQLHPVLPGVRWHHERYDGQGYPDGLAGDDIPLQARVLMVADAFDAMTSDRPYRRSLADEVALTELREGRRRQWHPEIVEAFLMAYESGRIADLREAEATGAG